MKSVKSGFLVLFLVLLLAVDLSAQSANPRVINGTGAAAGSWPFMVSFSLAGEQPQDSHFCGGVLISARHVLTAAHCVADFQMEPESLQVVTGRTRLSDAGGRIIAVRGIILHPAYSLESSENDIAIVHLENDAQAPTVAPVSNNDLAYWSADAKATVLGWGYIDRFLPVRPDVLQQGEVSITADDGCEERLGVDFKRQSMLCAGKLATDSLTDDGIDSCYGDSGGPLIVKTAAGYKVAGLVSWGLACGSEKYWGVYTRVGNYYDWIMSLPGVAPYPRLAPSIRGKPVAGGRLTCDKGEWGGDAISEYIYDWIDSDEGIIKSSSSPSYKIRHSDIGRNLICSVTARNAEGYGSADSESTGPIFPRLAKLKLSKSQRKAFKTVALGCQKKSCSLLFNLKDFSSIKTISAIVAASGDQSARQSRLKRVTADHWSLKIKRDKRNPLVIYLRLIMLNQPSKLIELLI